MRSLMGRLLAKMFKTELRRQPGSCQPVFPGGVVPDVIFSAGLQPEYAAAGFNFNGFCTFGYHNFTSAFLVPYKGYGQIAYLKFDGTSNYNSFQVSLQRRFSQGLTFGAVYTWSKSLATATSDQDTQDPFNALLDYRASFWDRDSPYLLPAMFTTCQALLSTLVGRNGFPILRTTIN